MVCKSLKMTVISLIKLQVILGVWSAVWSAENRLKLKVEISDQVPKHLCKLNLHNTQVERTRKTFTTDFKRAFVDTF